MIINKDVEDILKQIPGTLYGQALSVVFEQWKEEMNNVKTVKTFEELMARQIALKLIEDLFGAMENKKVGEKIKNQYI